MKWFRRRSEPTTGWLDRPDVPVVVMDAATIEPPTGLAGGALWDEIRPEIEAAFEDHDRRFLAELTKGWPK